MRNVAYAFVALSLGAMTSSPASAQCYGPECGGPRSGPPSGSQFYFNERPNNSGPREGFDQPPPRRGGPAGEDERRFDRSGNGPPRPQQHGGPPDGPPSYRGAPPDGGRPQYRTESAPPQRSELPRYDGTDRWPPPSSSRRGEPIPPGLERVERGPERRYEQAPGQTQGQAQVTILDRYGVVQQRYSEPRYSEAPRYPEPSRYSEPPRYSGPSRSSEPQRHSGPSRYSEPQRYPQKQRYAERPPHADPRSGPQGRTVAGRGEMTISADEYRGMQNRIRELERQLNTRRTARVARPARAAAPPPLHSPLPTSSLPLPLPSSSASSESPFPDPPATPR